MFCRGSNPVQVVAMEALDQHLGCAMNNLIADRAEVARGISLLFNPGDVMEVRIFTTRAGTVSGFFDDRGTAAEAICEADVKYRPEGIYYIINEINPALLGRAYNRLKERVELTTADNNIVRRRRLPVDLDAVRPKGISSTDEEHAAAIQRAYTIADDMAQEWGRPIIADSGNGGHLLYDIDLPNDPEALSFVSAALGELDRRYTDEVVKVDQACKNASRIWKTYGSAARKGDSIPGRPHRISRILEVPQE
jgi:hypothetical protein